MYYSFALHIFHDVGEAEVLNCHRVGYTTDRGLASRCTNMGLAVFAYQKSVSWIAAKKAWLERFDESYGFVETEGGRECSVDCELSRVDR